MAPKKAKAKKKSTGDDKGDEKVSCGLTAESEESRKLSLRCVLSYNFPSGKGYHGWRLKVGGFPLKYS